MLNYLSGLLDLKDSKSLALKLLMLIAYVSAQRGLSLHMLDISFMKVTERSYKFSLSDGVKQSRPGTMCHRLCLKHTHMTRPCV